MSNLLVETFQSYSDFSDVKFYDENSNAIKSSLSVICPQIICGIETGLSLTIYVKSNKDTTPLEKFIKFFSKLSTLKKRDDCYYYDMKFTVEQNMSLVEKIKDYTVFTINFTLLVDKKEIGG